MSYHLGSTQLERQRLKSQRLFYGDTARVQFAPADMAIEFGRRPLSNFWILQQLTAVKNI